MFDTPVEAHHVIEERFAPEFAAELFGRLTPAITFVGRESDAIGASLIGGAPDLPAGLAWPKRPVPANLDEIAKRSGEPHDKQLREHLAAGLPYAFFAQVDLGEAAGLGPVSAALPKEGRLLFFYDMIAGPFDTGTASAKVIWDRSPPAGLVAAKMPAELATAVDAYRRISEDVMKQYGLHPEARKAGSPQPGTPYGGPSRPMALKAVLQLPPFFSLEFQASGTLEKVYSAGRSGSGSAGDANLTAAYDELSADGYPPSQVLGLPLPVQDDPRYDAVVATEFNTQFLSGDDWARNKAAVFEKARDWMLLLQVDVADWMQDSAEGTLYFLIRRSDLEKRNFDGVVAVYQQT